MMHFAAQQSQPYTFSQLEAFWVEAGGPAAIAPVMAAIGAAESSWGTNLLGDNGTSFGIWQIHQLPGRNYDWARLQSDPLYNAWAAVQVWKSQGINAWTTAWSNDNGNTRVPFSQSAAGQILTHAMQGGGSAFGPTPAPSSGSNPGAAAAPGKPVAADWPASVKGMVVALALLILLFGAAAARGGDDDDRGGGSSRGSSGGGDREKTKVVPVPV